VGLAQHRREGRRRIHLRPERLQHDPAAAVSLRQPRHKPRPQQRRLAATRGAQDQQQSRLALRQLVDRGLQLPAHGVLPEEHRRMPPLKGVQPRERRGPRLPGRRPGQTVLPAQRLQALQQAIPTRSRSLLKIDHRQGRGLGFAQQLRERVAGLDSHRQHQLARGHRHPKLCQTPLRGGVGLAAEHDHRRTQLKVLEQLVAPAFADMEAVVGVEVKKQRPEALLLLAFLLTIAQPIPDPQRPRVVAAAVADEDRAHWADTVIVLAESS